jgi:hypothetical protein
MRIILLAAILLSFTAVTSQTTIFYGMPGYSQSIGFVNDIRTHDSLSNHKWFLSKFSGISTGVSFFNGGNAAFLSAPMGLQLNRRLNNNFYAFANIAVVPAFTRLNSSLITKNINNTFVNNTLMSNDFNVYPSASLGVMYINDAKTFSISGSISAERRSYPILPYYPAINRQSSVLHPAR